MKKIKLLVATIAMIMVSTVAFGQRSITITDTPENPLATSIRVPVTVEWYRTDGIVFTETVNTTGFELSSGVTVTASPVFMDSYCEIETIKIYVYYSFETHYAIYPGTATEASREKEPQYWIVVPK